jgi:hypothetical protein
MSAFDTDATPRSGDVRAADGLWQGAV